MANPHTRTSTSGAGRDCHARFQQPAQAVEALAKLPAIQRGGLVQRPDFVFQKRQEMQKVIDKISGLLERQPKRA